jgi:hypothetical protein
MPPFIRLSHASAKLSTQRGFFLADARDRPGMAPEAFAASMAGAISSLRLTRWIENSNPRARAASSSGRSRDAVVVLAHLPIPKHLP